MKNNIFTEKVNKIELSLNDDKKLHSFNRVKSNPYRISVGKVCKEELLHVKTHELSIKDG